MSRGDDELLESDEDHPVQRATHPTPPADSLWVWLRQFGRAAFLDNKRFKLVAVILAVTLFILVNGDKDVITAEIGVSYLLPPGKVLASEPVDTVKVTIRGPWRRVRRFSANEVDRVRADLSGVTGDEYEYQFREDGIELPRGLEVMSINPRSVTVEFDDRAERSVPVTVRTTGHPQFGYKLDRALAFPPNVMVRGPERVVNAINTVYTREIDLDERTESFTEMVNLEIPKQFVELVGPDAIKAEVRLIEDLTTKRLTLPVQLRGGPGVDLDEALRRRIHIEPAEVTVVARGSVASTAALEVAPVVQIFAEDLAAGRREVAVEIEDPPEGIGFETIPKKVTVRTLPRAAP